MPLYRIFTNDRGKKKGVALYSCFSQRRTHTAAAAIKTVNKAFGPPAYAPIKAIQWPPNEAGRAWLKEHVDA